MRLVSRLPGGLKQTLRRAAAPLGSVEAVRTSARDIVLTFDDGPDPVGTPAVLDALAEHGATATFFVLMTRVRRHPEMLARVRREGHEIGLHGADHRRITRFGYAETLGRTLSAKVELEALTGEAVRWFRPPYGSQTARNWLAVRRAGLTPVLWGPTTWDWRDLPQADRVWKSQQGARPGAVLLAHDAFAGASDGALEDNGGLTEPVVDRFDLVNKVLAAYAADGLRGRSLGEACEGGRLARTGPLRA